MEERLVFSGVSCGAGVAAFVHADNATYTAFLQTQPGFVAREILLDDSAASAAAAAAASVEIRDGGDGGDGESKSEETATAPTVVAAKDLVPRVAVAAVAMTEAAVAMRVGVQAKAVV